MPNALVKKYAEVSGKEIEEVEKLWKKAVALAKDEGKKEKDDSFYPYVVGILKNMLSINEDMLSYKEYREVKALSEDIEEESEEVQEAPIEE